MGTTMLEAEFGKFNDCHNPSGPNGGQFCSTGGVGTSVSVRTVKTREYKGTSVNTRTTLNKIQTRDLGEGLVASYLHATGKPGARTLNVKGNNFPLDLVQDHSAIEVKAGLISNGPTAQHWRATIGEPGKAEKDWLAKATPEQKARLNEDKSRAILARKQQALNDLSKALGKKIKAYTYGVIINPDTKRADIYRFDGFHLRIPWNSSQAKAGYVGTVAYNV